MGGVSSVPADTQTPVILNFILKEMFSRADLMDIYSLADPSRCSRYIVVAADALETLFVKLRLYPQKATDGTLYFQSVEGLTKGTSRQAQDVRAIQRKYCVELAFFFIRIFQTFAALTLSIFDSQMPAADPIDEVPAQPGLDRKATFIDPKTFLGIAAVSKAVGPGAAAPQKRFLFFGGNSNSAVPSLQSKTVGGDHLQSKTVGGSLAPSSTDGRNPGGFYIRDPTQQTISLTPYSILNGLLKAPTDGQPSMDKMRFKGFDNMGISQGSLYDFRDGNPMTRMPKVNPKPKIIYTFDQANVSYTISAILTLQLSGDKYTISLSGFELNDDSTKGSNIGPYKGTLIKSSADEWIYADDTYPSAKRKGLPYLLQAMFETAALRVLGEPPFSVVKLLRKFRYVGSATDKDLNIEGTHIYIPAGQENNSKVQIVFKDSVQISGAEGRVKVSVKADMEIEKPVLSAGDNTYVYKVNLDFSNKRIVPSELADILAFPSITVTKKFFAFTKDSTPKGDKTDDTIPDYLERRFQKIVSNQEEEVPDRSGIQYTREGLPKPFDSEDIAEDLRVKRLWKALAKDPPVKGHCVARATQLLSVAAIRGNLGEDAFSSACRLSFRYQRDGSLPKPGESIASEHGLYALATLFVEGLEAGAPKIVDTAKYKEFLRNLRFTFEKYPTLDMTPVPMKLSEITERLIPTCEKVGDNRITIPKRSAIGQDLRRIANTLLAKQAAHVAAAMTLIFKLFDRNSVVNKKSFALNPTILTGGTPAVNAVAAEARDLLLNYYKGCELTYREGLMKIYDYDKTNPFPSASAKN